MNLLTILLTSFLAVAAANPVGDVAAREVTLEARAGPGIHCDLGPFIVCDGGIAQEIDCGGWHCPGNGLHPIISNVTCAKQCVCEIPCP
ncbi:hypothetical protein B0H13DRAFT_2053534 [Mycena leptocephala]|nr:hypothetical protein B0H13DRAFT_2053534 [Mycena leptocephala]